MRRLTDHPGSEGAHAHQQSPSDRGSIAVSLRRPGAWQGRLGDLVGGCHLPGRVRPR